MQIPVGLLVDRLGTKKVLTLGVVLFTAGQLGFAFSPSYGMALASRALLGCGDAMTFISVLRLGTRWFPARRGPMVAQLAGLVGMAGNLVSTLVIARLLHGLGWTAAFAGSALAGLVVLVLMMLFLKDHPEGFEPGARSRTRARPTCAGRSRPPGGSPAPGSACGCTSPRSSRRWCSCCCGACRSWSRRRGCPGRRPVNCSPWWSCPTWRRTGLRAARRPAPRGPAAAGARDRGGDGPALGGDAAVPGRPGADVAAGRAVRGARRLRTGLDDRLRLRPARQPGRSVRAPPPGSPTWAVSSPR